MGVIGTVTAGTGSSGILTHVDTWANVRGTTSGDLNNWLESGPSSGQYQNGRMFFLFDSTNIPPGAVINSITYVHPIVGNFINNGADTVYAAVVAHTGHNPIGTSDYGNITLNGDVSFGSIPFSTLGTAGGTIGFSLNASGISGFNAGGITKYALRTNLDIGNNTPAGTYQYTSTTLDHYLLVDYNPTSVLRPNSKYW